MPLHTHLYLRCRPSVVAGLPGRAEMSSDDRTAAAARLRGVPLPLPAAADLALPPLCSRAL
jgi:hypothetical protein